MASSIVTSHFEELKKELDSFSDLFSQWTEQRRRVVLDDKEAYLRTLAEEQDTVEALKKQYQQLVQEKQNITDALESEEKERNEYTRQNHEYVLQRDAFKQKLAALKKETEQIEEEITKESKILEQREKVREMCKDQRMADLTLYRYKLGLELIPGPHNNTTLVFTKIDPKNPEKKFQFTIDYSDGLTFRLSQCHPILSCHQGLVDELNKDRQFLKFIGKMRASFVQSLHH